MSAPSLVASRTLEERECSNSINFSLEANSLNYEMVINKCKALFNFMMMVCLVHHFASENSQQRFSLKCIKCLYVPVFPELYMHICRGLIKSKRHKATLKF